MKYLVSILFLLGIAGCSNSTAPDSRLIRPAGAGSWFKYRWDTIDTTTGQVIRTEYSTHSIIATGLHYAGKANVSAIAKDDTNHITYLSYEGNGDISMRDSLAWDSHAARWTTLPMGSKGTRSYIAIDDTGETDHYTYIGEERVRVASTTFETIRIELTQTHSRFNNDAKMSIWISKGTGWIVKQEVPVHMWNGHKDEGVSCELVSYSLK
jgi:hypothetical protein